MTETTPPPGPIEPAAGKAEPLHFSSWLRVMAEYAGVADPSALHSFLIVHGCQCTRESAAEWLSGRDPSYEKSRDIIKAFHIAFPELEVWEEYRRFVKGEPYMQGGSGRGGHMSETLEQILEKSGLPPGLPE